MVDLYIIKKLSKRSSKQDLMLICFGVFQWLKMQSKICLINICTIMMYFKVQNIDTTYEKTCVSTSNDFTFK